MSFEPKIFHSEEPVAPFDGRECTSLPEPTAPLWNDAQELELPDDLVALAEQLRDDAVFLAQSHPANATPQQRAAAWLNVKKDMKKCAAPQPVVAGWRLWATGAAAAVLVAGASWIGWQLNDAQQERDTVAAVPASHGAFAPTHEVAAPAIDGSVSRASVAANENEFHVIAGSDEVKGPRVIRLPDDSPPRVIPAGAFLQDVSGPELDAMLELLAEQTDTGLSI